MENQYQIERQIDVDNTNSCPIGGWLVGFPYLFVCWSVEPCVLNGKLYQTLYIIVGISLTTVSLWLIFRLPSKQVSSAHYMEQQVSNCHLNEH